MAEEAKNGLPELSTIMNMLSDNPALMEMASGILSGLSKPDAAQAAPESNAAEPPLNSESPASGIGPVPSFDPELFARIAPMLGGKVGAQKSSPADERRCALLRALQPYLSQERRDAIDYMLKFSRFGDILQAFERRS